MNRLAYIVLLALLGVSLAGAVKAQTITTIAGGGPNGIPAIVSNIRLPQGVAADSVGNVFIVTSNQVYKTDTNGLLTIYAGTGFPTMAGNGDGGPATQATFAAAEGIAVDSKGNVFISDPTVSAVRRIDANTHIITTYADSTACVVSNCVSQPHGLATDKQGNLFIADTTGFVWRVDAKTQAVTVFAGLGNIFANPSPNGTPAASANIGAPTGVAVDGHGNVFVADDFGGRVYRIDASATHAITTIVTGLLSPAQLGITTDKSGNMFIADPLADTIQRWDASSGTVTQVASATTFGFPVAISAAGNTTLYVADFMANFIDAVDLRSAQQPVSVFAGNGTIGFAGDGYDASQASLFFPSGVITDRFGNLYIADSRNNVVRRVSAATNIITTYAGNAFHNPNVPPFTTDIGDAGPATSGTMDSPIGMAFDGFGDLYIADTFHDRIRVVDSLLKRINTVAGNGLASGQCDTGAAARTIVTSPRGVASDFWGNLFIADQNLFDPCIKRLDAFTRNLTLYADGVADGVPFNTPAAIVRDGAGNLYLADIGFIAKVDTHQHVTVVAGSTDPNQLCIDPGLDGISATSASLCFPAGVALDANGNLYIADTFNNLVREVDANSHQIYTIAGQGPFSQGFSGDGGPATNAQLSIPSGVFIDGSGSLLIADSGNNRIRKVVSPRHH
jgi:sugar lactone lactonase YvrE